MYFAEFSTAPCFGRYSGRFGRFPAWPLASGSMPASSRKFRRRHPGHAIKRRVHQDIAAEKQDPLVGRCRLGPDLLALHRRIAVEGERAIRSGCVLELCRFDGQRSPVGTAVSRRFRFRESVLVQHRRICGIGLPGLRHGLDVAGLRPSRKRFRQQLLRGSEPATAITSANNTTGLKNDFMRKNRSSRKAQLSTNTLDYCPAAKVSNHSFTTHLVHRIVGKRIAKAGYTNNFPRAVSLRLSGIQLALATGHQPLYCPASLLNFAATFTPLNPPTYLAMPL